MSAFITSLAILSAALTVVVGGLVWYSGDRRRTAYRKWFVWLCVYVCLWIISNIGFDATTDHKITYALISYGLAMGLVVTLLMFSLQFYHRITSKKTALYVSLPGIIMAMTSMIPGVVARDVVGGSIITNKFMLVIYASLLVAYILASIVILYRSRQHSEKIKARRISLIIIGMLISGIMGAYFNLLLPLYEIYSLTLLGPASAIVFISFIAYAIIRQGLFSIKFAAVRTFTYFLVLGVLVTIYFSLASLISYATNGPVDVVEYIIPSALTALVLVMIANPIKRTIDHTTNKIFFQDAYSSGDFLARLTKTLTETTDLRSMMQKAAIEISSTMKSEQSFFFIYQKENRHLSAGTKQHKRLPIKDALALDAYSDSVKDRVIVASIMALDDPIRRMLVSHNIEIALPLIRSGECIGYMCLGPRRSSNYTVRDIKILETVSDELVIAVQNALSIQEVRDLNETLQQRIDEATSELRRSNAQLQRLDEAKDEFVSMASHQLRTPLTSVKGYIDMVIEGDAGEITDQQKHLLREAFTSSERMVHLINDFLNVSRLQTGKFIIDRRPIDPKKLVAEEIDSLKTSAEQRQLKLLYKAQNSIPKLNLDEGKMRQVVMNFIDNALYYSRPGTAIKIDLRIDDGQLVLTVKDTGIGVPKSEQAHLFSKFFRATNARKQRPDGTGVGLFLAKKVVTSHGGKVIFESEEGVGSTFGFNIPISKNLVDRGDKAND